MKINGLQPQEVYKTFSKDTVRTGSTDVKAVSGSGSDADRLEVSQQCADLNEARRLVDDSGIDVKDDDREEKIEGLKSLIEQGQYNISAKDVASSILNGRLLDSRA
jgi:negative regulator of flagellin synthesis FlgM